jgi:hypothetical protein
MVKRGLHQGIGARRASEHVRFCARPLVLCVEAAVVLASVAS